MGLTITVSQDALDYLFPTSAATDYIAYSTDGSSEWANLARTSVGATGWSAATSADPSVKANANTLTSDAVVTSGDTVTHFAIYSASTSGTQRTDWQALDSSRTLAVGDSLQWASGDLQITLT